MDSFVPDAEIGIQQSSLPGIADLLADGSDAG